MKSKLVISFFVFTFFVLSCKKNITHFEDGLIIWTGDVAVDGCGWLIQSGDYTFHPKNLSVEFQQDSLNVSIDLKYINETFTCGLLPSVYNSVEIRNIRKR
jgi:hypothetical protein